ncbi:PHO85 cyclin-9 [Paramyrothecium foliicola]|nr:PHO85 cyclin-9 [Paramyrothecium foliicola]
MDLRHLTMDELNKSALEHFVYQRVDRQMIAYLADAAQNVITCDPALMPSNPPKAKQLPTPPRSPVEPQSDDANLPSLEEFITQLVVSSNVQVPTLMSTLVYLTRLKAKLQPMARGLRCTSHRILLAALILAAKYLNDSSPKNKHWANYSHITTDYYSFGFNRTEVNLMEKQLLFLLEWDLRITEEDLYRELDCFLEPIRQKIADKHIRKMRQREEKLRQQEIYAAATRFPSPPSSRGHSRSRNATPEHIRHASGGSITPPGLSYGSSASSYASSIASSRRDSRSATPLESEAEPYMYEASRDSFYDSPVQIVMDMEAPKAPPPVATTTTTTRMLPYEISPEEYQMLHDGAAKKRQKRGVWGRLLGGAVAVR